MAGLTPNHQSCPHQHIFLCSKAAPEKEPEQTLLTKDAKLFSYIGIEKE